MPMPKTLIMYTSSWCGDCREAKRWLTKHKIPFSEIDIEETPGAAEAVVENAGKRAIPQFVIDGQWVQPYVPGKGFKYAEMAELFGVTD
jgi:mycoredoxin